MDSVKALQAMVYRLLYALDGRHLAQWRSGRVNGMLVFFIEMLMRDGMPAEAIPGILDNAVGVTRGWVQHVMEDYTRQRVKKIEITLVEGPTRLCGQSRIFTSWDDASAFINSQWRPFLVPHDCDHAVDYKIVWSGGKCNTGTVEISRERFMTLNGFIKTRYTNIVLNKDNSYGPGQIQRASDFLDSVSFNDYELFSL